MKTFNFKHGLALAGSGIINLYAGAMGPIVFFTLVGYPLVIVGLVIMAFELYERIKLQQKLKEQKEK